MIIANDIREERHRRKTALRTPRNPSPRQVVRCRVRRGPDCRL